MNLLSLFRKAPAQQQEQKQQPSLNEIGYYLTELYQDKKIERYDPDVLRTTKGIRIYDNMMADDQVKPVLLFKQYAVISRDHYFDVGDEDSENYGKNQEIAEFFEYNLEHLTGSFSDKLIEILSALKHGFSICEKVFEPIRFNNKEYWGIKDIKLRPASSFLNGFVSDKHGNILRILQNHGTSDEVEIPLDKIIHFVHQPEIDRHYGESDLRGAYRSYWAKDIAIRFENIHLERHASGFIWAQIDKEKGGLSDPQITNLQNVLDNITAKTAIHVPASVTLNAFQPLSTEAFDKAIMRHNAAIAKSMLVPNLLGLSEAGKFGQRALGETQLEAFFWILDFIAKRLEECINEQLFKELAYINFLEEDYPKFKFENISDAQVENIVKLWNELIKGGSVTKTDVDEAHIRKTLKFPEKPEEEEEPGQEPQLPEEELPVEIPDLDEWIESNPKKEMILKAFEQNAWLKRVNFAKIENQFNTNDEKLAKDLSNTMGKMRLALEKQIIKVGGDKSWGNVSPKEIESITVPKNIESNIRKILKDDLQLVLNDSYETARRELPKKQFKRLGPSMDRKETEKFLSSRSMRGAATLSNDALKNLHNILFNGIKYDKTLNEIMKQISEDDLITQYLPEIDSLGRALNKPRVIETIARTNIAEAVNNARQSLFTDPDLKGFVQAYEYSAILDDRVTDICEHLNGKILRDFSNYVPPNHFNCRSVLVPVTVVDDWDGKESPRPRLDPQKGFA